MRTYRLQVPEGAPRKHLSGPQQNVPIACSPLAHCSSFAIATIERAICSLPATIQLPHNTLSSLPASFRLCDVRTLSHTFVNTIVRSIIRVLSGCFLQCTQRCSEGSWERGAKSPRWREAEVHRPELANRIQQRPRKPGWETICGTEWVFWPSYCLCDRQHSTFIMSSSKQTPKITLHHLEASRSLRVLVSYCKDTT